MKASEQMKWEAFHQQRMLAEELIKRLDQQYLEFLNIENARAFTDYSFLNILEKSRINPLQRSPLSVFPPKTSIAGVVGYFQVDNAGQFSTPIIPENNSLPGDYGLTESDLQQRLKTKKYIYSTLKENKLIKKINKQQQAIVTSKTRPSSLPDRKSEMRTTVDSESTDRKSVESQAGFDRLQESSDSAVISRDYSGSLGRVEDLNLAAGFDKKFKDKSLLKQKKDQTSKRAPRKERNVLPETTAVLEQQVETIGVTDNIAINIFESEVDAMEISFLKSGHFVLYRKVWRADQRYIQGVLIEAKPFIAAVVEAGYKNSLISKNTDMVVAFEGHVISVLKAGVSGRYLKSQHDLKGTLLLNQNLASSFPQIQLIFSVNQLPMGPGGVLIAWLSLIIFIVLLTIFYILYRLGVKQLELVRQQQDFVSAVSHELKTPLTSIRMYGEMLREGWVNEEKRKLYYDYIYDESERLSRLINNVLQLARMTRNEIKAELKLCTVAELLDIARSKLTQLASQNGFELIIKNESDTDHEVVEVDADYFTQILINLLDNAIKFSANAEKKCVEIACRLSDGGALYFYVRDYGPGIDKEQAKKIFTLFYRSENELTRDTVGTGIGLALVSQLMRAMNGSVEVHNGSPGAEFQLKFKRH